MRRLTDHDLIGITGSTIEGYRIEVVPVMDGSDTPPLEGI